jgi:sigma-B regulation protein RsbU (phosphoserine phosphatase)
MTSARILVVDDEAAMIRSLERILSGDHEVRSTTSPIEALILAKDFKPHLAVVDIRMEAMDGFELMSELKGLDPDLEVILMTGSVYEVDQKLIRAIREKAFYYINKPFDREVLRTLVARCLELREAEDANRRYVAHLESQMAEVRAFQQSMLPPGEATIEGFRVFAAHRPTVELAGDLYDYASAGNGRVALLIADVVGHGASAAMLTGIVKAAFRSSHADRYDPLAVVRRVSEGIAAFEADRFVTLISARLASADRTMEYVNAGHYGGLIAPPGGPPVGLDVTGPLISPVFADLRWERQTAEWTPDSTVLLYTDGIPEASDGEDLFGTERLHSVIRRHSGSCADLLREILDEATSFSKSRPAADDMTLLALQPPK